MLDFFKEVITELQIDKDTFVKEGSLYVLSKSGTEEGRLLISKNCSLINFGRNELSIDGNLRILDKKSSEILGHYRTTNWTAIIGYKDKLVWGDREYSFEKVKPDVSHSFFDKQTWGHFKFQLVGGNEMAIYRFRIETESIVLGNPYVEKSISGKVELNSIDTLIALAGFGLVERALDDETLV